MNENNKPAGFLPSDLVKGGLKTDFNAEFTDLFWDYYVFPGKDGAPGTRAFGLHVHFTDENGDADEQFYSAGKPEEWAPSRPDKSHPVPNVKDKALNDSSNYAVFIRSVIECGIAEADLREKVSSVRDLVGMNVFMSRVEQPSRSGLDNQDGKKRTVLVCKRLNRAPWEKAKSAGKKSKAAAASSGAPAPDPSNGASTDDELKEAVSLIVMELLPQFPQGMAIKNIMPKVFQGKILDRDEFKARKSDLTKALLNPTVLGSIDNVKFEGGVLSFA